MKKIFSSAVMASDLNEALKNGTVNYDITVYTERPNTNRGLLLSLFTLSNGQKMSIIIKYLKGKN